MLKSSALVAQNSDCPTDCTICSPNSVHNDAFDAAAKVESIPCHMSSILSILPTYQRFWWRTTGITYARMLQMAQYPAQLQRTYVAFYYLIVLPEFGHDPARHVIFRTKDVSAKLSQNPPQKYLPDISYTSSSPISPHDDRRSHYRSFMTDDHSPIEFSCVFNGDKGPVVRFAIDPIKRQAHSNKPVMQHLKELASTLSLPDSYMLWCRVCAEELTATQGEMLTKPVGIKHRSQYFVGFEFTTNAVGIRVYFSIEPRFHYFGVPKQDLVTNVVHRLSQLSIKFSSNLIISWNTILTFFGTLPEEYYPSVECVAVDCAPSHLNRLKLYVRTTRTTLHAINLFMTLGHALKYPTVVQAMEWITIFWELMFPGVVGDEEPHIGKEKLRHPTAGLLFYYDLRSDRAHVLPKLYIPVRHLCRDDEEIVKIMEAFYARVGLTEAAEQYRTFVENVFVHRQLSTRTGIHTYVSINAKADSVEITAYFNPECFCRENMELSVIPGIPEIM